MFSICHLNKITFLKYYLIYKISDIINFFLNSFDVLFENGGSTDYIE
jgi:hypothetical protein